MIDLPSKSTLQYYDKNAGEFSGRTFEMTFYAGFNEVMERFLNQLNKDALILDLGCGSGRDAKLFLEKGFQVEAIDGSEELCKIASNNTGIAVKRLFFHEFSEIERYDGVWAQASLLHLKYSELQDMLIRIWKSLKPNGVFFSSFKYGEFEGIREGRYFTDMTEERLDGLLSGIPQFKLTDQWISNDVRPERGGERWLNQILRNVCQNQKL